MIALDEFLKDVHPKESRMIPQHYDLAHSVAFKFHDELAKIVVDLESTGSLWVNLDVSDEQRHQLEHLEGEDLWSWIESIGRTDVLLDMTYRQISAAVISDAAHFIFESLSACAKGKTAVAFSLLRKPLKENLLLLEWICGDPEDFILNFHGESADDYILNRLPIDKRKKIVKDALAESPVDFFDFDFIWGTRFDKSSPRSLETLWTKATHLVTSVKASATEPGNLNFVFSNDASIHDQWDYYYQVVPLLLLYMLNVAESVVSRFIEWDERLRGTQLLVRHLAFIRYAEFYQGGDYMHSDFKELEFTCTSCNIAVNCSESDLDLFWSKAEIRCASCGNRTNVWDLLADE